MQKRFFIALPLAAVLALPALAQDNTTQNQLATTQNQAQTQPANNSKPDLQPLTLEQHEGFWGRINPFARKKYVRKQLSPVVGRVNELDELTASNTKLIKDVDSRAQEGIRQASAKASAADSHALDATNRANQANETATQATNRLQTVEKTVSNIDQYQHVQDTEIRFRPGHTALSSKAKEALDQMTEPLKSQRGYVVEVQGFAPGRGSSSIQNSQRMAESVVRYLVENGVPVYRIYTLGMGNAVLKTASADGSSPKRITSGRVEITLLRNDLSSLESAQNSNAPLGSGGSANPNTMPQSDQMHDQPRSVQQNAPKAQVPPPAPPKN